MPNRLGIGPIFDPLMTSKNNKKRWADAITIDFRKGQIFRALVVIFDREYRSRGPRNTFDGDGGDDWTKIWKLLKYVDDYSK